MKPLVCSGIAIVFVALSFGVFGQQGEDRHGVYSTPLFSWQVNTDHTQTNGFYAPMSGKARAEEDAASAEYREHEKQARTLYASGNLNGAENECLRSLASAPIVGGQRQALPLVQRLLGRVYLRQGRNQDALKAFQSCYRSIPDAGQNLDIAIAYARLGDYQHARRFYSDRAITEYRISDEPLKPEDMPGTNNLKSLESSALLARGIDEFFEERQDEALDDFMAAERLAPDNALIAYYCGETLLEKGRTAEAIPRLRRTSTSAHANAYGDVNGILYAAIASEKARAQAQREGAGKVTR